MSTYCTTHDGEVQPCKTCAAIERNKKLREEVAAARAAMPAGMLDGPGEPPTLVVAGKEVPIDSPLKDWTSYPEHATMTLDKESSKVFADALVNPPASNEALKQAATRSVDPFVAAAEAYADAKREERAVEEQIRSFEASVEAYKLALEAARVRTLTAKHAMSQLMEQQ